MDVVFFIRALEGGGAQRDSVLLANAVATAGLKTGILTLNSAGALARLVSPDVAVEQIGNGRMATSMPALRSALQRWRARIVFSSETAANLFVYIAVASISASKRPFTVLREVTAPSVARQIDPYIQNRMAFRLIGRVYARAGLVLTLTSGARNDLIENFGVPEDRVNVLTSNAVIDPETERRLQDAVNRPPSRIPGSLVSIGRLSPEKNHVLLVDALAQLRSKRPIHLTIVGEGPAETDIKRRIQRHGLEHSITLAGPTRDAFAFLLGAEMALSSSKFEGLGNVLIEALASGTPVVSTDCPYGPREILDNGRYGRLVAPDDPAAMAGAIAEQLDAPVDRAALRNRAALHTSARAADNFIRLINRASI